MSQNSRKFNHPKLGFILGLAIALVIPTLASSSSSSSSPAAPPKPTTRKTQDVKCEKMYGYSAENYDNLITIGKRTEEPKSRFILGSLSPDILLVKS